MVLQRCPQCGAGVRAGSPWCTLCYAVLTAPTPAPTPVSTAPTPTAPTPLAGAAATHVIDVEVLAVEPLPTRPATTTATATATASALDASPSWPCSCGHRVPMTEDVCPACGNGFLATARLPGRHRASAGGSGLTNLLLNLPRPARLGVALLVAVLAAVALPAALSLI